MWLLIFLHAMYTVSLITGVSMLLGGILALITSPFIDSWDPTPIMYVWPFLFVLTLIVIASIAAISINTFLLSYYSATFMVFFAIFIGLYLFYQEELRQGYIVR